MFLAGVAYAYSVAVSDRNKAIPLLFVGTTYPVYPRYLRRYAYGLNVGAIATSNQRGVSVYIPYAFTENGVVMLGPVLCPPKLTNPPTTY